MGGVVTGERYGFTVTLMAGSYWIGMHIIYLLPSFQDFEVVKV